MPQRRPLDEKFLNALFGEDELGVVVRAHIHIEARLNELVALQIPYPEELPRLRYEQTLRLACALGLRPTSFAPLKELGDIRNRFGHKLDSRLTDDVVQTLYGTFSKDDKETVIEAHSMTQQQLNAKPLVSFDLLTSRDRFILMVVVLEALLGQACAELEDRKRETTGA